MDDLDVVAVLGEGPFSTVAHCRCTRSGADVVVKMYHKDKMNALNCRQVSCFPSFAAGKHGREEGCLLV